MVGVYAAAPRWIIDPEMGERVRKDLPYVSGDGGGAMTRAT